MVRAHALLLLADVGPQLVQLDHVHRQAPHHFVMQGSAASPDPGAKPHDRIPVDASQPPSQPPDAADAHALGQGGNDGDLPIAGEDVHRGASASVRGQIGLDAGRWCPYLRSKVGHLGLRPDG